MSNQHYEKWMYKTFLGFLLIAGGVLFMYYSITQKIEGDWILYGLISGLAVAGGAYFLSSAAINKVKSDLIRKQKIRQQSA